MIALAPGAATRIARPALILAGLCVVVSVRWAETVSGSADGLAVGIAFGLGLLGVALAGGWRPARPRVSPAVIGFAGGAVLVLLAITTHPSGVRLSAPAATFEPWAVVTVLVACAEEAVLRGALFTELDERSGVTVAVLVTSIVFALLHVPLYGWHVVPLDLGVGLWLAGLRLASGGVAAPAIAHALADLATWWL